MTRTPSGSEHSAPAQTGRHLREDNLSRLERLSQPDVVILGGGVNGVATFRDLALNGISCVLLDTGDFCAGASSASSRMAHGGLRYLEGREFRLVAESARERNRLIKHAHHLVRPLEIVVPVDHAVRGLARSLLRFAGVTQASGPLSLVTLEGALGLYEFFGRRENPLPRHTTHLRRAQFPHGLPKHVRAVTTYFDGLISNPEGLIMEVLEEAIRASETVCALNHTQWTFDGEAFDIEVGFAGTKHTLRPKVVLNATGAWIDNVNALLGCPTTYIRGVKGAHVILHNDELLDRMGGRAFYFDDGSGRMVIALSVENNILVGTTEVETDDPQNRIISDDEIDYLIGAIDGLFSDIRVDRNQIVSLRTGIRPLQNINGKPATNAARDHALHEDRLAAGTPLLSLVGGKWTTFRAFAEETADRTLAILGNTRRVSTAHRDYLGAAPLKARDIVGVGNISKDRATTLVGRYGSLAREVAWFCAQRQDRPLTGAPSYSRAEIEWHISARAACTIEDLVLRRTQLTFGHGLRDDTLQDLGAILVDFGGRDPGEIATEINAARGDKRLKGAKAETRDAA